MPVPDRHEDEPAKEIDRDYYRLWREAQSNAKAWEAEATRLRKLLEGTRTRPPSTASRW